MRRSVSFVLEPRRVMNSNKTVRHYMQRAEMVRYLRTLAAKAGAEQRGGADLEPLFKVFKVQVTVFPPTRRRLDPPNLYPSVKALVDGLTDAGWWDDDSFDHLVETSFRYGGLSGSKQWRLVLDVEEVPEDERSSFVLKV